MQLWAAVDGKNIEAVCVTEIIRYPRKRFANVLILTGRNRERWQGLYQSSIEAWAKAESCDGVESLARLGWQRVFPDYRASHVKLEKTF